MPSLECFVQLGEPATKFAAHQALGESYRLRRTPPTLEQHRCAKGHKSNRIEISGFEGARIDGENGAISDSGASCLKPRLWTLNSVEVFRNRSG